MAFYDIRLKRDSRTVLCPSRVASAGYFIQSIHQSHHLASFRDYLLYTPTISSSPLSEPTLAEAVSKPVIAGICFCNSR